MTTSGEDLGTALVPVAFGAGMGIPFAVHSFIETLAPGEIAEFSYSLEVVLDIPAFDDPNGRQIFFRFLDPLQASSLPPGAIQFGTRVPAPPAVLLFGSSLLILGALRRRRIAS